MTNQQPISSGVLASAIGGERHTLPIDKGAKIVGQPNPLSRRIKHFREKMGISQAELGRRIGVSRASVSQYEAGKVQNLGMTKLVTLAKALQCDAEELATGSPSQTGALKRQDICFVPVILIGEVDELAEIIGDPASYEAREHMPTTAKVSDNSFAILLDGDDMVAPDSPYRTGGHVVFDPDLEPVNGDCVLVSINGDEAIFRQLRLSGSSIRFRPLNVQYPVSEECSNLPYDIKAVAVAFSTLTR